MRFGWRQMVWAGQGSIGGWNEAAAALCAPPASAASACLPRLPNCVAHLRAYVQPAKDALDTMVLGAVDLDGLDVYTMVDHAPFDPTIKRTESVSGAVAEGGQETKRWAREGTCTARLLLWGLYLSGIRWLLSPSPDRLPALPLLPAAHPWPRWQGVQGHQGCSPGAQQCANGGGLGVAAIFAERSTRRPSLSI